MDTRQAANKFRLLHWERMFTERLPGESVNKFCERNGVSRPQFFYWQRKLRAAVCTELTMRHKTADTPAPSGWAVCEPAGSAIETNAGNASGMFVGIGNFRIMVDDNFDTELFAKVCRALVTVC